MPLRVQVATLLRAANILGSSIELARKLGVSHKTLRVWMHGEERTPDDVYLRAVDILEGSVRRRDPSKPR